MLFTSNKQIRGAYSQYKSIIAGVNRWNGERSLDEAYGRYSCAKQRAWYYCEDLMASHDGSDMRILGHNCMTFSVGFIGYVNGLKHFFYITRDYDRAMPLEKVDENTGEVLAIG